MKRIITVLVVVVLLAVIMPAGLGCAKPPSEFEVSGTMEITQEDLDPYPKTENGKLILEGTIYYDVHGTLEGKIVFHSTTVVDFATGSFTSEGHGTFTGTVKGKGGNFVYNSVGSGQGGAEGESAVATSEETIIWGMGGLAKLRGSWHTEAQWDKDGISITYSGTCWFEE